MLIYLAGAISVFDRREEYDKATKWRSDATVELKLAGYEVFNPTVNFHNNLGCSAASVVAQNGLYLRKSDIVLLNLEELHESPGTLWELFMAKNLNIPVVAFGENKFMWSPHVSYSITQHMDTLEGAIKHIKSMYHLKI